jgi:ubiquitin carboxyl-terminal hydrolase 12/46
MRLKQLPNVLALHLKRFKFIEQAGAFRKISYRVAFPKELRMPNTSEKALGAERMYRLFAVVVPIPISFMCNFRCGVCVSNALAMR